MKRHLTILIALAAAACGAESGPDEAGYGSLRIDCRADARIETAASRAAALPDGSEFALRITGDGFDRSWERMTDFAAEDPLLKEGRYTATVSYGDPDAEGYDLPCFRGSTDVTVVARRTATASVTARLTNVPAVVRATPQFLAYYHDIRFALTTEAGNEFLHALDAEGYEEREVYVRADGTLTVAGTARRQSQTGTDAGIEVRFDAVTRTAELGKRHIFLFDAPETGGATLTIRIGDDYTETVEFDCELNEEAR
jgi:catechol 2,3-dioxygenase-like lactoylglutathione lyase family enzyme